MRDQRPLEQQFPPKYASGNKIHIGDHVLKVDGNECHYWEDNGEYLGI